MLTAGAGPGPLNKIGQQFQNNILDVRKVLESPLERKAKSLAFTGGVADVDNEDLDLTGLNEVDSDEENHNDPVLDVISAFFGHDAENITNVNEKNEEITDVNNDLSILITNKDKDIAAKQPDNAQRTPLAKLTSGPKKAKLHRDGRMLDIPGGLDFSSAVFNEKLGKLCMEKQEEIESIEKRPILECNHK